MTAAGDARRQAQRRARLQRYLQYQQARLAAIDPSRYTQERYYRAVRTTRERKIRQIERLLVELKEESGPG